MEALLAVVHGSQLRGAWPLDLAKDDVVWLLLSVPGWTSILPQIHIHTGDILQFAAIAPYQPLAFPGCRF
jgi:hypothetical protein